MGRETLLIVGAGNGLSGSLARLCASQGMQVALAGRSPGKLTALCEETGSRYFRCDASEPADVERLFEEVERDLEVPKWVVFNASFRIKGPVAELNIDDVRKTVMTSCYAGFLVAQQAARRMVERGGGSIFFTGASASVKGYALSAPFAMGKFGLRGLAQSMARELQPKNIHIAHFVIDGGIGPKNASGTDNQLDPDAIASTYLATHQQDRTAWSTEVELRPFVETF